ncbi:MAG: TerB N-terminal domain-containing protein [Lachnospiraceae bacterium]|nr:TerB N-terminal domain-containing protein [Lachnospiraceae bacterium]
MSGKRNPFNDNVNRLMEKIFTGKNSAHILQKGEADQGISGADTGILHDTKPGKKAKEKKKSPHPPVGISGGFTAGEHGSGIIPAGKSSRGNTGDGKEAKKYGSGSGEKGIRKDFPDFSLMDIRRTTEKIRETTKQIQQITLSMWAETIRGQEQGVVQDLYGTKIYGEESIPPRYAASQTKVPEEKGQGAAVRQKEDIWQKQQEQDAVMQREGVWQEQEGQKLARQDNWAVQPPRYKTPEIVWKKRGTSQGTGTAGRVYTQQYRMEEGMDALVPERIRECRALSRSPQGYRMTKEELFYTQALLMADYVDDCPCQGDFTWYFPTYQAMNLSQLRGYFTWRARVRQGDIVPAPLSFAFVYVYELLHQVGAKTPVEGFFLLKTFWEKYREYDLQLDRYMQDWLCDYVVYYNLGCDLLQDFPSIEFDRAMLIFLHPEEEKEEDYFAAICTLSKYNVEGSKFYKEKKEDVCRVTCGVFRALTAYYSKHGKKTLPEKYFGTRTTCAYQMFASAVFYDYKKYTEYAYEVNPLHRYQCINGHWSCEKYFGSRVKNREMGQILRAVDARMRERYEYKALLKPESVTKLVLNFIDKEIDRLLEEKKRNTVPAIEIDLTKLSGIRRAAELTREKLLVEESGEESWGDLGMGSAEKPLTEDTAKQRNQKGEEIVQEEEADSGQLEFVWMDGLKTVEDVAGTDSVPVKRDEGIGNTILNEEERTLLHCLLTGAPYQEFLRSRHRMLSVVVDAINDKLFDQFSDTVIVFDGDVPVVLEDYVQEVASYCHDV